MKPPIKDNEKRRGDDLKKLNYVSGYTRKNDHLDHYNLYSDPAFYLRG